MWQQLTKLRMHIPFDRGIPAEVGNELYVTFLTLFLVPNDWK